MRALGRRLKQTAVDWFGLPPDTLLDASRLTCLDAREVALYNVAALEEVSEYTLSADLGRHKVRIDGTNFTVTLVGEHEVHLVGDIVQITYTGNGGGDP